MTDTESLTGVAPVCETMTHHVQGWCDVWVDDVGVYDCCPQPHIECWSASVADEVAKALTAVGAKAAGT